jgi:hypothetical protein
MDRSVFGSDFMIAPDKREAALVICAFKAGSFVLNIATIFHSSMDDYADSNVLTTSSKNCQ